MLVKNQVKQNSTFWDTNSNDVDVDEFLGLDTNVSKGKDLVGYGVLLLVTLLILLPKITCLLSSIQTTKVIPMVKKLLSVLTLMIRNLM